MEGPVSGQEGGGVGGSECLCGVGGVGEEGGGGFHFILSLYYTI